MDAEEIGADTWEAWAQLLSPGAKARLGATKHARGAAVRRGGDQEVGSSAEEQATALFELAVELRDRLRFSQKRIAGLKSALASAHAGADAERARAAQRLAEFEGEIMRLGQGVAGQASAIDAQEATTRQLQAELAAARQQARAAQAAAEDAHARAQRAEEERSKIHAALEQAQGVMGEAEARAEHHERQHTDLMGALLATKARLGELSAVEGLWRSARDELGRLDKENGELKEMVSAGIDTLGRSRYAIESILDSMSTAKSKSLPLFLTPQVMGKKRSAVTGRKGPARGLDVIYDDATIPSALMSGGRSTRRVVTSPGRPGSAPSGGYDATALSGMAWLGPPTAAYPPDPEHYVYLRVAGGYSPKYVGTLDQPKASGWVPKDVVRLVQAFRHAYGLEEPEWRFWEPLLLLVDEVYRARQSEVVSSASANSREKMRTMQRKLSAAAQYPSVVQAGRIGYLRRQLEMLRQSLGARESRDDSTLRAMAEKGYHLSNQLDAAVDENVALRHSLRQLDEMYTAETGSPEATVQLAH